MPPEKNKFETSNQTPQWQQQQQQQQQRCEQHRETFQKNTDIIEGASTRKGWFHAWLNWLKYFDSVWFNPPHTFQSVLVLVIASLELSKTMKLTPK